MDKIKLEHIRLTISVTPDEKKNLGANVIDKDQTLAAAVRGCLRRSGYFEPLNQDALGDRVNV